MAAALAACGDDPVLLFANPKVVQFYPRFGFRAQSEALFGVDFPCAPGTPAAALAPEQPKTRALIRDLACACLLYTSPSPRDRTITRMPSSA